RTGGGRLSTLPARLTGVGAVGLSCPHRGPDRSLVLANAAAVSRHGCISPDWRARHYRMTISPLFAIADTNINIWALKSFCKRPRQSLIKPPSGFTLAPIWPHGTGMMWLDHASRYAARIRSAI